KLQMPAGLVQMQATAGALAPPGSSAAATPAFPPGVMVCQSCHDISGYGFCLPTGVIFCPPTMVLLGVTPGDIFAGVCAVIGDSLRALASSYVGNAAFGSMGNQFLGNVLGGLLGTGIQTAWSGVQALVTWEANKPDAPEWAKTIAPYITPG